MTLLGREDLEAALKDPDMDRRLVITPLLESSQVGRGAVDLRLGTEFLLLRRTRRPGLNPAKDDPVEVEAMQERVVVPFGEVLWLHPRHFVLAATVEYLALPDDMSAYVVGRSSWGRLGLIVATAIFVHPGFRGCLTLELVNEGDSPIALSPGHRVAQVAVHRLEQPAPMRESEGDTYAGAVRPEMSRLTSSRASFQELATLGERLSSRLG